jgi:molybdate transport system regulatory protein
MSGDAPRLWLKVDFGARGQIGPGKIALLRAIAEQSSISAAAKSIGMSYRKAWLLIDQLNHTVGRPVVETQVGGSAGGGAQLTAPGRRLIDCYELLQKHAESGSDDQLKALAKMMHNA